MNYSVAYATLAQLGMVKTLQMFADKWSRWPNEQSASGIIKNLNERESIYRSLKCEDEADKLELIRKEIVLRCGYAQP